MRPTLFASALLAMCLTVSALPMPVAAAEMSLQNLPTTLQVSATAEVHAAPDMAMMSAGVMTTAQTAKAAMQQNAARMSAVMAEIQKAGIEAKDIQTSGLSLQPQYRYTNNMPPVVTGYQASNMLNLRLRKIDSVGPVLDALVAKGINQINGPTFVVSTEDAALDQARRDAVARARKRAELYAEAAGMKVKRILSINEGGGYVQPIPMMRQMAAQATAVAPDTPVAPGENTLSVTVQVMFELM